VSNGAAVGTTPPGIAGRRTGTTTPLATGTTTTGSGLFSPQLTRSADADLLTHGQNPAPEF